MSPILPPLELGSLTVTSPVILAPMAGITNRAFRRLCRESVTTSVGRDGDQGSTGSSGAHLQTRCLFVSEMVTSRALVERTPTSLRLIAHDADERVRSVQLYGVEPATVGAAVRMLVTEDLADHIDLNFGCPVPKVTRKGGGAALPWKLGLFRKIVAAAVAEAAPYRVPVTVKMRKGIDEEHLTYLEAGRIAEAEGVAAVALHARTAAQHYSGTADWAAIAALKQVVTSVPVLGNGDVWSADDALRMVRETGCDGIVVGRGCLGRPWLFADLVSAFDGQGSRTTPSLGHVGAVLLRHARYLVGMYGDEAAGCRDIRKHIAWYLKGYPVGHRIRRELTLVETLGSVEELVNELDAAQPWPGPDAEGPRGRGGGPRRVALPDGWLETQAITAPHEAMLRHAELGVSGG